MHTTTILFPFGVRLSTWLVSAAFVGLAVWRRDWRSLLAAAAWIWGFEVAFQLVAIATRAGTTPAVSRLGWVVIGVPVVVFAANWVRPEPRVFAAALALFAVWVATGFDVNGHGDPHINVTAEVLNELAKTVWALAYLLPLLGGWRFGGVSRRLDRVDGRRRGRAGRADLRRASS